MLFGIRYIIEYVFLVFINAILVFLTKKEEPLKKKLVVLGSEMVLGLLLSKIVNVVCTYMIFFWQT